MLLDAAPSAAQLPEETPKISPPIQTLSLQQRVPTRLLAIQASTRGSMYNV